MAGRIRSIKPEILENERTASLSHEAWRLFVSMITLADDYGNLYAAPARVAGAVFWGRSCSDIAALLDELCCAGLVLLYECKGQRYAHLIGWREHQKVDHPGKPRVPGPDEADATPSVATRETLATDSRKPRETVAPDQDQYQDHDRDQDNPRVLSAAPQGLELALVEPIKAPNPYAAITKTLVTEYQQAWISTRKPTDGEPPKVSGADFKQLLSLVKRLGADEVRGLLVRYLADGDAFLAKQGHPLRLLASRADGYRATTKPKAAGGMADVTAKYDTGGDEKL